MQRVRATIARRKRRGSAQPSRPVVSTRIGLPQPSASSFSNIRRRKRSYSAQPTRTLTPSQESCTSRAITSQPSSTDSLTSDRMWNTLTCAHLPTSSKHVGTFPSIDLSSLHVQQQFDSYTCPATVIELISAIARGQNVNRKFHHDSDNDIQAFSVPRPHRSTLQLTQLLTSSLNPDCMFNPNHLGQHDYVLIDNFLHSDLFQQVRSIFATEIHTPSPSDFVGIQSRHLPVLIVAQALTALTSLSEEAAIYLQGLTIQGHLTPDVMLVRLSTLHSYADNILHRRSMMHAQLLSVVFAQLSEIKIMVNLLASYGVTYGKIVTAVVTSAAIHAELVKVYELYHTLLTEHLQSQPGLSASTTQVGDFSSHSASALTHTDSPISPASTSACTTPLLASSQPSKVREYIPWPRVFAVTPNKDRTPSPMPSIEFLEEVHVQKPLEVKALLAQPQRVAGPEDGPSKPILSEQQRVVASLQRPTSPSSSVTCFFCNGRHCSSNCLVISRLTERIKLNANRGGCFLCCERHGETECPLWETKRCSACKSKWHDTSFCDLNNGVDNDIDAAAYSGFLELCRNMADMVRKGESTGFH